MVAFVFGAGASFHAGYPLTAQLGNRLHDWARQNGAFMWRGYLEELFEQYGGLFSSRRGGTSFKPRTLRHLCLLLFSTPRP